MSKKGRSTWGSKRPRGESSWQIRFTDSNTHERVNLSFRGTESEADRKVAKLRIEHEGAQPDITLAEYWDNIYYPEALDRLAESTLPEYERTWRKDIEPEFGDTPITQIKPSDIQAWLKGMTRGKAKHAKSILSAILSSAFAAGLTTDNPAQRRFVMPTAKASRQRSTDVYTEKELQWIFSRCAGEVWEAAFIIAAFGGASREEAMSPKPSEVQIVDTDPTESDPQRLALIPIVRGVQNIKGKVTVLESTKNEYRERVIIIPEPYSTRLGKLADEAAKRGDEWLTDDGFGEPMDPNVMAKRFERWFQSQPMKYIPFSNLRNAYATYMHAKGADGYDLAHLMGHADPSTTYRHYDRPKIEDRIESILRIIGNE